MEQERGIGTDGDARAATRPGAVPVYGIWAPEVGPLLSLGMLSASARAWHDGSLGQWYEIRRPETVESFLIDLAGRCGPAVLLCSNYVWSLEGNLRAAAEARRINPDLVIVHGGPSTPTYDEDIEQFFAEHGDVADVLAHGEGEATLSELLGALVASGRFEPRLDALADVRGVSFRSERGDLVRTPDRTRIADLDSLPSPFLTGEFDHIEPAAWGYFMALETSRGCPYGCTFCDWGSATMSRVRKFSVERVRAELAWGATRGIQSVHITDANFGITSRDVEVAQAFAGVRQATGLPHTLTWSAAKNTTRHLVKIMDLLEESGVASSSSLSLQTIDPDVLAIVDRSNISTERYRELAGHLRRRGHPLIAELMVGLPGQTMASFKRDVQFMVDHEIMIRGYPVALLPNSPMNEPHYRRLHQIEAGPDNLVRSTASFDPETRARMWRFKTVEVITERMGVLRHVMRYLQWDHGIPAVEVMDRVLDLSVQEPERYPLVSWLISYFDLFPTAPVGWAALYDEVAGLISSEFGIAADDPGLRTVLAVQHHLMPAVGRSFPDELALDHDYVGYYRSAARSLYTTGRPGLPDRPLAAWGPGTLRVEDDPLGLGTTGIDAPGDPRGEEFQGDMLIGATVCNELRSPLTRLLPALRFHGVSIDPPWDPDELDELDGLDGPDDLDAGDGPAPGPVGVTIGRP